MTLRGYVCIVSICAAIGSSALATPFVPTSDSQVLERLPFPAGDPAVRLLRRLSRELALRPDDLPLAIRVARGNLELGRVTGDPRYAGYAQAALTPWWNLQQAPQAVLVLRATLRQRMHEFEPALADLETALEVNPRNIQARLTRATLLQVQGSYDRARDDCRVLQNLTQELVWTACLSTVDGVTGQLRESYVRLRAALDRSPNPEPAVRGWVLTSLAEMAARAGMAADAEMQFRAVLSLDSPDNYLLGAYADFLLDRGRFDDVAALLRDKTRVDPLLLRYALALQGQGSTELPARVEQLRDRFTASRLRGDRLHLREEARFTLQLLSAPEAALSLAQENWRLQKEPIDLRILLEAALGARDAATVDQVREWLRASRLEDIELTSLMADEKHPS
jgi:tetratricopeptide (TPR) repeat protein